MRRALTIQKDFEQIGTIEDLTSIFEAIASIHISQIRDKVLSSTRFFNELWNIYSQLRANEQEEEELGVQNNGRLAVAAITSEGGLIGDIDERIVQAMLGHGKNEETDLFMIGTHGASLMTQHGVRPQKSFTAPNVEQGESVHNLAKLFGQYAQATIYYQTYVSLMHQDVARIDLSSAVQTLGAESTLSDEIISSATYILEPSAEEIIQFMESAMLEIALGQVMLESRLAQYASRFNAMYAAKTKALELKNDLRLDLNRAKRAAGDERTKEILSSIKAMRQDV